MKYKCVLEKDGFITQWKMKYWNGRALKGENVIVVKYLLEIDTFVFVIDFNRSQDRNCFCMGKISQISSLFFIKSV